MKEYMLFFLNENYKKPTDLLVPKHDFTQVFIDYIELSVAKPLSYNTFESPSKYRKKLYDSDALYVDVDIFNALISLDIVGLYIVPVEVCFSDGEKFLYFRVDSKNEYELIDYSKSTYDEDGDLEVIVLDYKMLDKYESSEKHLFKLKGLEANQYLVSQEVKNVLSAFGDDIEFATEEDYQLLW